MNSNGLFSHVPGYVWPLVHTPGLGMGVDIGNETEPVCAFCPLGGESGLMFGFMRLKNQLLDLSKMKSPSLGNRKKDERDYQKNEN